jgi:hypothetical protein
MRDNVIYTEGKSYMGKRKGERGVRYRALQGKGFDITRKVFVGRIPKGPETNNLPDTNIRLGWKGLPETNTLAYCENP